MVAPNVKKLAAIIMLFLLLFNLIGYRAWFYYTQQKADKQLVASLDKEAYNDNDLITIKIPLSLPYQTDQRDFERVDGEIKLNGTIYKYVKRKVYHGELVLLCLPDHNKMKLESAKGEFFKLANSLQTNTPTKKPVNSSTVSINNILSEYDSLFQNWSLSPFASHIKPKYSNKNCETHIRSRNPLELPPESHKA